MQEAMQILHQLKQLMTSFSPAIVQMVISAIIILIYIVLSRRIAPFLYRTIAASVPKKK